MKTNEKDFWNPLYTGTSSKLNIKVVTGVNVIIAAVAVVVVIVF